MDIDRTTVPGTGVLFHLRTPAGAHFALLLETGGTRRLLLYGESDEPIADIALRAEGADRLADLLRSRPVGDRLTRVERRLDLLTRDRRGIATAHR
ncbi:hypothetical protein OG225_05940 [Nocardia sp. NBC_01377]|uniref:hypothetical protein n=1 Tax=Nocardia sp. NBC_01377 TaxID=2903595 RepID=UPI0032445574